MPFGSDEKRAEKQREQERRQQEKQAAAAEAERQRQEQAFWASPQGRARAARMNGSRFFQISLALSQTERTGRGVISGGQSEGWDYKTKNIDPTDLLGLIESEGWRLENVGYVFRETGSVSRDKLLSSGQTAAVMGEIVGVYLFRTNVAAPLPGPPPGQRASVVST